MKKIAITSQKGGVGKTTMSLFLANKLFFEKQARVLIVDCDLQFSCSSTREKEYDLLNSINKKIEEDIKLSQRENDFFNKASKTLLKYNTFLDDFKIVKIPINKDFKKIINELLDLCKDFDYIIFDTPGTLAHNENISYIINLLDFVFVPIELESKSMKSGIDSLISFQKLKPELNLYGFVSRFNGYKEQTHFLNFIGTTANEFNIEFLTNKDGNLVYTDSKSLYQRELINSSFIQSTLSKEFRNSLYNNCLDEIIYKIEQNG